MGSELAGGEMTTEYKDLDDVLDFGKYKGASIRKVIDDDPKYLEWCIEQIPDFNLSPEIIEKVETAIQDEHDYWEDQFSYWDVVD